MLAPWSGPYGGVPPFEKVKVEDFQPALETAMAEALAEIDTVASDPAPPTFENTIVGLERSGRALDRVRNIFGDLQLDHEHARLPEDRRGDGTEAGRLRRPDHPEREALQAHRRRL